MNPIYRAWTCGLTPLPIPPRPVGEFTARSTAQRGWSEAAQRGVSDAATLDHAYASAWDRVAWDSIFAA